MMKCKQSKTLENGNPQLRQHQPLAQSIRQKKKAMASSHKLKLSWAQARAEERVYYIQLHRRRSELRRLWQHRDLSKRWTWRARSVDYQANEPLSSTRQTSSALWWPACQTAQPKSPFFKPTIAKAYCLLRCQKSRASQTMDHLSQSRSSGRTQIWLIRVVSRLSCLLECQPRLSWRLHCRQVRARMRKRGRTKA